MENELELSKPRYTIDSWKKGLQLNLILISISLILRPLFKNWNSIFSNALFELLTTVFAFGIPIYLVLRNEEWKKEDFGLLRSKSGFIWGIMLYLLFSLVFLLNQVFFGGYQGKPFYYIIFRLFTLLCIMFLVDLWFHGYMFLGILKNHGLKYALIGQNLYWFFFHIFEIFSLIKYIGIPFTIFFILITGFLGDVVTYKYRSIYGLAIGHFLLNVLIIIFALTS